MINIIKSYFGYNTKQAKEYIKNTDKKTLEAIKENFNNNAKNCFLED